MANPAKPKRTAAATAKKVRAADDKFADRLRSHGWIVVPPEHSYVAEELIRDPNLPEWTGQPTQGPREDQR